jgi:hypothetical protein
MRIRTKSNLRGLRDIRTRTGRVDRTGIPYMAYMKISCLEMEKARREKEKFAAETRVRNIDVRLADIEREKGGILVRLGERSASPSSRSTDASSHSDKAEAGDKKPRFKIRY